MADMKDFAVVNEVYKKYFTERYPARTSFQVLFLLLFAFKNSISVFFFFFYTYNLYKWLIYTKSRL